MNDLMLPAQHQMAERQSKIAADEERWAPKEIKTQIFFLKKLMENKGEWISGLRSSGEHKHDSSRMLMLLQKC